MRETRVARLLLAGSEPGRILCLTFTKAAAAEMSSRLYKRLGDWAMLSDEELARKNRRDGRPRPRERKSSTSPGASSPVPSKRRAA